VPWWLFCLGILTFVGSQVVHLPLNEWLADIGIIEQGELTGQPLMQIALVLGLTAGLSEELARAVGYWFLFRRQRDTRWQDGVMLGLGHGGIESMAFGAVLTAATVSSLWALRGTDLATLNLPAGQAAALRFQLEALIASPWAAFAPLLERAIALIVHVSLSLLVWFGFKRRNVLYLLLAVILHAAIDAVLVYLVNTLESVWLIETALAAMALPGLLWIWALRPRQEARQPHRLESATNLTTELALFGAAVSKELRHQWRAKRLLVVTAVFLLFGLVSPLIARFTPELLRGIEGAEQFADLIPAPTTADALGQYIKNITQFGFILAVLLGMGAVAGEKEKGTAAMILSKPLPRWAFVLSKFTAQGLVYGLAFIVAAFSAYYYTLILFEPLALGQFLLGNFLLFLWLLTFAAVTLLATTIAGTTTAAAGIALAGSVILLLLGTLPRVGALAPAGLVAWASQLGLDAAARTNGGAVAASVVLIVICLVTAVAIFEIQEL
ncbi:MAG TPA: YhfC family glutamic-type intramembrane protease, partial [Anaerolineae bacterium]